MERVLIFGFEPFAGETINPSQEIVKALHGTVVARREIVGVVLPCVFGESARVLKRQLRTSKPALVIGLGQAGGRPAITPERIAINLNDARIPDNSGQQPIDGAIVRGGPAAYWSTLPIKAIVAALNAEQIAAAVSQTAGTFVCNHVFYSLMHALRRAGSRKCRGGFIHVPWLPQQAQHGEPSLSLDLMVRATVIAIEVSLRQRKDVRRIGGATH